MVFPWWVGANCQVTDMGLAKFVIGKTYTTCGTPDAEVRETTFDNMGLGEPNRYGVDSRGFP